MGDELGERCPVPFWERGDEKKQDSRLGISNERMEFRESLGKGGKIPIVKL